MPQKLFLETRNMRKKTFNGGSIMSRARDGINAIHKGLKHLNVNSSTLGLHMAKYKMNDAPRFLSNGDKFNDLKNIKFNNPMSSYNKTQAASTLARGQQDKRIKFII